MGLTHIPFRRRYRLTIGFLSQMIQLARHTVKLSIAVFARQFWIFSVFKDVVVTTFFLKTSVTFSFTAGMMIAEVTRIEETRQLCNDIKVSIMHE